MSAVDSDQILTTPMLELSDTVDEVEEDAEVVFDIGDLSVSYGDKLALRDVSMKIRKNQVTAFIGPSGCGKSTLIRCLNRMNDGIATMTAASSTTARTCTARGSTSPMSADGSAWSSSARTRSRSRSSTTSPTARASRA